MEEPLFYIRCTTCDARLKVLSEAALGAILTCPKCESMVQVIPPPDWKPRPRVSDAVAVTPDTGDRPHQPSPKKKGKVAKSPSPAATATLPPPPPPAAADPQQPLAPPPVVAAAAPEAEDWALSPVGESPAAHPWRRWVVWSAVPVAGVVLAAVVWALLPGREAPAISTTPTVATVPQVKTPPKAAAPSPVPTTAVASAGISRRWLPDRTRALVSLRLSELSASGGMASLNGLLDPAGPLGKARVWEALSLKPEAIRRVTWASTDLNDWAAHGLVLLELDPKQDIHALDRLGRESTLQLGGVACRQLDRPEWPRPFAVLDAHTVLTGEESLLRELSGRKEAKFDQPSLDRWLEAAAGETLAAAWLDQAEARKSSWKLPTEWLDVWPEARGPWRTIMENPRAAGLIVRPGPAGQGHLSLFCDGETSAQQLKGAIAELSTAAGRVLTQRLQRMPAKEAQLYESVLKAGKAALDSVQIEAGHESVWVRVDLAAQWLQLLALARQCQTPMHGDWLLAALEVDRANQTRLADALKAYQAAQGRFPPGAGGGTMLPPEERLSWLGMMLPSLGHEDWSKQLDSGYSWNSPKNRPIAQQTLPEVINPALGVSTTDAGFPVTHYVGVGGVGENAAQRKMGEPGTGVFGFNRAARLEDIPDGASNTLAILGVSGRLGPWASGGDATVRSLTKRPYVNGPDGFGSGQPDGMLACMADGSVRFISKDIDPEVLEQLATVGGGEKVDMAVLAPKTVGPAEMPQPQVAAEMPPAAETPEPAATPAKPEEATAPKAEQLPVVDVAPMLASPLAGFEISQMPLRTAVNQVADMLGLPVTFDLDCLNQLAVRLDDPVSVKLEATTLGDALKAVVSQKNLAAEVVGDQLLVTAPEDRRTVLRKTRFTVTDLTDNKPAACEALAKIIERLVAPEAWQSTGGQGQVWVEDGSLWVSQTEVVRSQIIVFCEKLRAARGKPLKSRRNPETFDLTSRYARVRELLIQPVTVNYHDSTPLGQLAHAVEEASGCKVLVDWTALAAQGIPPSVQATLTVEARPLGETLDTLTRAQGLAYRPVDRGLIEISTPKAIGSRLVLEFYPVGPLLAQGVTPQGIEQRIKAEVADKTWSDAGGPAAIYFDEPSQCLLVLQSAPAQQAVESLLAGLRSKK